MTKRDVWTHREIGRLNDVKKPLLQVVVVGDEVSHVEAIVDDAVIIGREVIENLQEFRLDLS